LVELQSEAQKILSRLRREQIEALYHFTSVRNLPGISRHQALLSKKVLESIKESPPEPGGNALSHFLDGQGGNWEKVSLNFTPHTPMAYNIKHTRHICFFALSPCVAGWPGVCFTDTNAASPSANKGYGLKGLKLVDFAMVRSTPRPSDVNWKRLSQAEILVPNTIPIQWVSKVIFVSGASLREGMRLWGADFKPPFVIDITPFADYPGSDEVGFSFVDNVVLTDSEGGDQSEEHKTRFKKSTTNRITAVISFKGLAGTTVKAHWSPANIHQEANVRASNSYVWRPFVDVKDLADGVNALEVALTDVTWSVIDFEVVP
jgi:hypothetical protein